MNVAVAEVVCAKDIDPSKVFLRGLQGNLSWLDLLANNDEAAFKCIHNGLENTEGGLPAFFL